ncbi:MAG: hypothetical protein H5T68_03265 [Chloroflexi bacterium]|nr:hypothetical protein [Chloroflexota bacterium]
MKKPSNVMLNLRPEQSEGEVNHLAVLGEIRLKLRETPSVYSGQAFRFAQGDKIFNTLDKDTTLCILQPRVDLPGNFAPYYNLPGFPAL